MHDEDSTGSSSDPFRFIGPLWKNSLQARLWRTSSM
jgi:hypothetical protein